MEVLRLEERYEGATEIMFHLGLFKIFIKVKIDSSQLI